MALMNGDHACVRPRFRLRTTLVVPFVLQIVTAVGLVGYLSFRNGQKAIADLAGQLSNQVSNCVSEQLNHYLATPRQTNELNLQAINLGMLKPQDFNTTGQFFWKQMKLSKNLSYIDFGSPQGLFIGVGREDDGSLYTEQMQPSDRFRYKRYALDQQGNPTKLLTTEPYQFQEDAWYKSAVAAGKPIWSPIYQWSDRPEILSISSSYPVYDSSKRLIGVLGVDFVLSQISDFLRNLHISPSGRVFVMEPNGLIVASSSQEKLYREVNGQVQRLNIAQSQEPLMREAARQLRDRFGQFEQIVTPQFFSMKLHQEQAFVSVTPWKDALGLHWIVVVVIPESDFMTQINANTRNTLWLCLAALATAITIGILTARWVTRPILAISQASANMAQGNIDQRVASSSLVEIDQLANSFNAMAEKIKQSFTSLRQSEAHYQAMIDAIPDLLLRVNRDGTYLSDAVGADRLRLFSGGTSLLAQTTVQDSLPPQPAQQRMAAIEKALRTGQLQIYEQRLVINGEPIDEEVRIVVLGKDEVMVMVRDISDRKRAEESLRIAEENYRSIFENALEGIFQSSPEGRYINVNPAMARIYGYDSPQEMLEMITDISTQVYVDPKDQTEFKRQMEEYDQVKDFEYQVYQKDREIIWIQEDTRAVRDNAGQLLYYEGMMQDISDRKRREDDLRRQLEELKIEIDQKKREKEVAMLTESSYFQEVQQEMAQVNLDEFWR